MFYVKHYSLSPFSLLRIVWNKKSFAWFNEGNGVSEPVFTRVLPPIKLFAQSVGVNICRTMLKIIEYKLTRDYWIKNIFYGILSCGKQILENKLWFCCLVIGNS